MFERKRKQPRTEVEQADRLLEMLGTTVYELGLPKLTRNWFIKDDINIWFEDFRISFSTARGGVVAKVTGNYAVQDRGKAKGISTLTEPYLPTYYTLGHELIL